MSPGMANTAATMSSAGGSVHWPFEPRPREVRLVQRDADLREPLAVGAERTRLRRRHNGIEDVTAKELGGRELALEGRDLVEVLVGERLQRLAEHIERRADIDDDVLRRELITKERDVDDEEIGRAPCRGRVWRDRAPGGEKATPTAHVD